MSLRISAIGQSDTPATLQESSVTVVVDIADDAASSEGDVPALTRLVHTRRRATTTVGYRRGRGGRGSGGGRSGGDSQGKGLYTEDELDELELMFADGITAVQAVELFVSRGVRLSEASFRKYVQQGLLPRSRRVGRKGKHRGSMGMYPAKTVRRINEIKRFMADGYTIEEIQAQFLRFKNVLETLQEGFKELFSRFEEEMAEPRFDRQTRRSVERDMADAKRAAEQLLEQLDSIAYRVGRPRGEEYRNAGAAGSAEDLL